MSAWTKMQLRTVDSDCDVWLDSLCGHLNDCVVNDEIEYFQN